MSYASLDALDQRRIEIACHEYIREWLGGPFNFGVSDAVRYTVEGYLGKMCDRLTTKAVWAAVREYVDAHPELVAKGPMGNTEKTDWQHKRDARRHARTVEAVAVFNEAKPFLLAGDVAGAMAILDRAELVAPDDGPGGQSWDWFRDMLPGTAAKMAGAKA